MFDLRFPVAVKPPTFNLTATLDRAMGQVLREGVRAWVVYMIEHTPVETGMAIFSFQPLGRALSMFGRGAGSHMYESGITDFAPKRAPYYSKLEGVIQSPAAGEERAHFAPEHLYKAVEAGRTQYTFDWWTDTKHWFMSEHYFGVNTPGPDVLKDAEQVMWETVGLGLNRRLETVALYVADQIEAALL